MEQLAGIPGLRHAMQEVQPSHRLLGNLGVDANHLGVIERCNHPKRMADGGQEDIAARLIRLRFQRKLEIVALIAYIVAQKVERLAKALHTFERILGGVSFSALAPAPE